MQPSTVINAPHYPIKQTWQELQGHPAASTENKLKLQCHGFQCASNQFKNPTKFNSCIFAIQRIVTISANNMSSIATLTTCVSSIYDKINTTFRSLCLYMTEFKWQVHIFVLTKSKWQVWTYLLIFIFLSGGFICCIPITYNLWLWL